MATRSLGRTWLVGVLIGSVGLLTAAAGAAVFDSRENVNVMNTYDPNLTFSAKTGATPANQMRSYGDDCMFDATDGSNYITVNLGEVRNVKTIRMLNWDGYHITGADVLTSTDGSTFTALPTPSYTYASATGTLTLDSAVDTQHLRVVPTGYNNSGNRWIMKEMRVFGDVGTLSPPNNNIDLVSSTGLAGTAPTVVMTVTAGISGPGDAPLMVNDALTPLARTVLWQIDTGEGFTLAFENAYTFTKFGFHTPTGQVDVNAIYTIEVSMDDATWGTPVYTSTDNPAGLKFVDLTPKEGKYLRFTFADTSGSSNYINDVMVFGSVPSEEVIPEPATMALLGLGVGGLLLRRRRRFAERERKATAEGRDIMGRRSFRRACVVGVLIGCVGLLTAAAGAAVFDYRENVNVVNADDVVITAKQTSFMGPPSNVNWRTEGGWDGGPNPPGGTNYLEFDFQEARSIKTIRMRSTHAWYGITSATVETSDDGTTWTSHSNVLTGLADSHNRTITLDAAASARHLRVTGTGYDKDPDEYHRWTVNQFRVLGDSGATLAPGEHLDLVAGTAYTGGVTFSRIGTVNIADGTDAQFVDDALDPLQRGVMYFMGQDDGFQLQFDRTIDYRNFGFWYAVADTNATFNLESSTDGGSWSALLTNQGGLVAGANFFDIAGSGQYLRFTFASTGSSDNRISDVMLFQTMVEPEEVIPEPASAVLVMAGLGLVLRRRRARR